MFLLHICWIRYGPAVHMLNPLCSCCTHVESVMFLLYTCWILLCSCCTHVEFRYVPAVNMLNPLCTCCTYVESVTFLMYTCWIRYVPAVHMLNSVMFLLFTCWIRDVPAVNKLNPLCSRCTHVESVTGDNLELFDSTTVLSRTIDMRQLTMDSAACIRFQVQHQTP